MLGTLLKEKIKRANWKKIFFNFIFVIPFAAVLYYALMWFTVSYLLIYAVAVISPGFEQLTTSWNVTTWNNFYAFNVIGSYSWIIFMYALGILTGILYCKLINAISTRLFEKKKKRLPHTGPVETDPELIAKLNELKMNAQNNNKEKK